MQPSEKPIQFHGGAGEYFIKNFASIILMYVIIFGWPIAFNLMTGYVVDNLTLNGKKLKYSAGYGEVLVFLLVNILLLIVTLGIWSFWFVPRSYRFIVDHTTIQEAVAAPPPVTEQPQAAAPPPQPVQI
jgi:uncharacterized membrane protein YjgN (DUF898 family)